MYAPIKWIEGWCGRLTDLLMSNCRAWVFTYDCLVVFRIFFEGRDSLFLIHDVVFLDPPVVFSVSLRSDVCDTFYCWFKAHLEPLFIVVRVWSPATSCSMKPTPGLSTIGMRRRYTDHVICYRPIFHSQWFRTGCCDVWTQIKTVNMSSYCEYVPPNSKNF